MINTTWKCYDTLGDVVTNIGHRTSSMSTVSKNPFVAHAAAVATAVATVATAAEAVAIAAGVTSLAECSSVELRSRGTEE